MAQLPYAASHHKGWQIDQTFHPKPSHLAQWSKRRKIEKFELCQKAYQMHDFTVYTVQYLCSHTVEESICMADMIFKIFDPSPLSSILPYKLIE